MGIDLSKINSFDPNIGTNLGTSKVDGLNKGPSFKETLAEINKTADVKNSTSPLNVSGVKFSNHAIERMRSRGVSFTSDQMSKLEGAIKKAAEKGGRDSLVLMNDTALIVSVKNNTVVTVVDKNSLKENVFTNIDSTIVV